MFKRILLLPIITMLVIGTSVVPTQAYTPLKPAVTVTARGIVAGNTANLSVGIVTQSTGSTQPHVGLGTAAVGIVDSGEALKIQAGTNLVDSRIIIYTDNDSYFPNQASDPSVGPAPDYKPTGIDGGGMPGDDVPAYVAPLFWGVHSDSAGDPNDNINYVFDYTLLPGGGVELDNAVWIVDKRHNYSFIDPANLPAGYTVETFDDKDMYKLDGTLVVNDPQEGANGDRLYPQLWDEDLYDRNPVTDPANAVVISQALFKNIATVAYSLGYDGSEYTCSVPKLSTPAFDDNVTAELGPTESLYLYIGGDFTGRPAQTYETTKLTIEMVKD